MITLNFDATSEPANPITPLVIDFVINGLFLKQALYSAAISYNNPFLDRLIFLKSYRERQNDVISKTGYLLDQVTTSQSHTRTYLKYYLLNRLVTFKKVNIFYLILLKYAQFLMGCTCFPSSISKDAS